MLNRYKIYLFFKSGIWIGPIATLFYLVNKLSFTQILIVASSYRVAVAALEVPTGAIADRIGHKKSVLFGMLIHALGLFLYPLFNNCLYYIMCEIIIALGSAFISGVDEALFYNYLKNNSKEKLYSKFMGSSKQYSFLSQIIGSLVAVPLFNINHNLPFIVSSILFVFGFITSLGFEDDNIRTESNIEYESLSYLKQIREAGKYILKHKRLKI